MSAILEHAVARLSQKIAKFDGVIKFSIIDEGEILLDQKGVRIEGGPSQATLTASADVFEKILLSELNAMTAYMSGKLQINGDMSVLMRVARALSP